MAKVVSLRSIQGELLEKLNADDRLIQTVWGGSVGGEDLVEGFSGGVV